MEKRLILAIVLSLGILLLWQAFFAPPPPEPGLPAADEQTEQAGSSATQEPVRREFDESGSAAEDEQVAVAEPETPPESVAAAGEQTVEAGNELFTVRFSNRGARILSWTLNDYGNGEGEALELIPRYTDPGGRFPLAIDLDDASLADYVNDERALYLVERSTVSSGRGRGERVAFSWADGKGVAVEKALTFYPGQYLVDVELRVEDRGRRLPARLGIGPGFGAQAAGKKSNYYYAGQLVTNRNGAVSRKKAHKVAERRERGAFRWAGLEDQYFAALVLPGAGEAVIDVSSSELTPVAPEGVEEPPDAKKTATVSVSVPASGALLYVGPKRFTELRDLGYELDKVVWFSSNGFLYAIAKWLFLALLWIHANTVSNYGVAIILTTLVLRIILFPLNQYSMVKIRKSQQEMQKVQPKVNALRKKYKNSKDPQARAQMNQEMMALYKKEGVNPMGGVTGCLPMLAQFPILIGFFNMLTVAVELRGAPFFGWIGDLSSPDPLWITPLAMGATMFWQQRMAMSKVTDPTQRQQQRIMMFMPFMFTILCISMPSGLVIYWFTNNVLGIGQQWLVNRHADTQAPAPQTKQAGKKKKQKAQG